MSIEQRNEIADLKQRVQSLEQRLDELISSPPKVSGQPSLHKTGTLTLGDGVTRNQKVLRA